MKFIASATMPMLRYLTCAGSQGGVWKFAPDARRHRRARRHRGADPYLVPQLKGLGIILEIAGYGAIGPRMTGTCM
jgi:hypothetical protein